MASAPPATKPRVAVLEFKNKADNQWWYHGGAEAAQDVFVTELVKSGKFRVVEREQLEALMAEKNLTLSGDVDPSTAVRVGKLLGVNYLLTGSVTEYGVTEQGAHGRGVRRAAGCLGGKQQLRRGDERPPDRHLDGRDRLGRRGARPRRAAPRCTSAASAAASTTTGCSTRS